MSDDDLARVHAPGVDEPDVPTVPRGGGAPITDNAALQQEHVVPEQDVTVHHTEAARIVEQGGSPYPPGLAPDRPNRSTLDSSVGEGVVDNHY